ncbi:phosphopentomutase [Clostridia bacterium OttesenSCG-928-F22]|nr:phosphopentomutase [Clostridia bacterium OttesenSCG-928-F22]
MARVIIIVLDSLGVGALPDAARFGDEGANTLGHIAEKRGLSVPNMLSLGLGNIPGTGLEKAEKPKAAYGKSMERFLGKDTTGGHWEIAGYILEQPFPTYPDGFPMDVIEEFCRRCGVGGVLGNKAASGTEIIKELGDEHKRTKWPIVYTSADSVFQIAAYAGVIPLEELYRICKVAREVLHGEHAVGRVIARPFTEENGAYVRTKNRRDFSLQPEGKTLLDAVKENGMEVIAIGKIEDIFAGRGVTKALHTTSNEDGIEATVDVIRQKTDGLVFTNLVDFDMLYGHRNDLEGYGAALEYFDKHLLRILDGLYEDDLLIITADHGCDPTFPGTDHTREYVPLLAYRKGQEHGADLGVRDTFADIAATAAEFLKMDSWPVGTSFLSLLEGK